MRWCCAALWSCTVPAWRICDARIASIARATPRRRHFGGFREDSHPALQQRDRWLQPHIDAGLAAIVVVQYCTLQEHAAKTRASQTLILQHLVHLLSPPLLIFSGDLASDMLDLLISTSLCMPRYKVFGSDRKMGHDRNRVYHLAVREEEHIQVSSARFDASVGRRLSCQTY